MKAAKYILIKAVQDYNNTVKLKSGLELVVNTSIETVENINREVEIISAPSNTILKKGDKIIIHHNILRRKNDVRGREVKSDYHIDNDIYFVPPTEVFLYKRDNVWKSLDPFVFISPIKQEIEKTESGLLLDSGAKSKRKDNIGTIRYINQELTDWGLKEGSQVYFTDNSEYEFNVEGEILYRMKTSDILAEAI